MKAISRTLAVTVVLAVCLVNINASAAAQAGSAVASYGAKVKVAGFAGSVRKKKLPPKDYVKPGQSYQSCLTKRLKKFYAFVNFKGMANGTTTDIEWQMDGQLINSYNFKWNFGPKGKTAFWLARDDGEILEDGVFRFTIKQNGATLASAQAGHYQSFC